jgi:hypothetical protein
MMGLSHAMSVFLSKHKSHFSPRISQGYETSFTFYGGDVLQFCALIIYLVS